jgi:hypothetical protein
MNIQMKLTKIEELAVRRIKFQKPLDPPVFIRTINKQCSLCVRNVSQNYHQICLYCYAKYS